MSDENNAKETNEQQLTSVSAAAQNNDLSVAANIKVNKLTTESALLSTNDEEDDDDDDELEERKPVLKSLVQMSFDLDCLAEDDDLDAEEARTIPKPPPLPKSIPDNNVGSFAKAAPKLDADATYNDAQFKNRLIFEDNKARWEAVKEYQLPQPGAVIGNYRIESILGQGGFGAVYRVRNLTLNRREALKLILPKTKKEDADAAKRFRREIDIASRIEHPNIVRVYNAGTFMGGIQWMTMEIVRGEALDQRLERVQRLSFAEAKSFMMQLLSGLMEAHLRQIVHRDLKPANIMLTSKPGYPNIVKILDFGLSKAVGSAENQSIQHVTLTNSMVVAGTPRYMAPEQLSLGKIGPWTDVYAAGLIFYEILTGFKAVDGDTPTEHAYRQLNTPLVYPQMWEGKAIKALLEKACAKDPNERFIDAGEMLQAMQCVNSLDAPESVIQYTRCDITMHQNYGTDFSMAAVSAINGALVNANPIDKLEKKTTSTPFNVWKFATIILLIIVILLVVCIIIEF